MSIKASSKDSLKAGEMEIDMTSIEAAKSGEKGTIKFTPNAKAKDTTKLRMVQVVRDIQEDGTDYKWTGSQARLEDVKTQEKGKAGEAGSVEKGWMVDHNPAAVTPRSKASDPAVSPAYRDYWANNSVSQDGHKNGADIQHCSLWDFPGISGGNLTWRFETAAQGADGTTYGTVKWGFTVKDSKVINESHSFQDNPSATFNAAVDKFNDVYHNPGSPSAPKPAATPEKKD
jgi:hypothetical protein